MALFPSISELFTTRAPAAPMTAPQLATAANAQATTSNMNVDSNNTVPNGNTLKSDGSTVAFPATKVGDAAPLDGYKDLWTIKDPGINATTLVPTINADPAAMLKAAQTIDFTKSIDPIMLDKASKGDATALAGILNSAAQSGYAAAAGATVNIVKAALSEQANNFENKYAPNMLRNASINNEVSKISLAADPASAPIVSALTTQLSAKFPTASPSEISAHVSAYLDDFAQRVVGDSGGKIQTKADLSTMQGPLSRKDEDWGQFFGVDPNQLV